MANINWRIFVITHPQALSREAPANAQPAEHATHAAALITAALVPRRAARRLRITHK